MDRPVCKNAERRLSMSVYMSSLVKANLQGDWSQKTVKLLQKAMGGWWSR